MAMMMARLYTGSHDIITLRNAYHGLSGGQGHAAMGAPAVQPAVGEGDVCLPPVASRMIGARWLPAAPPLPLPRPPTQRGPWACWGSTRGSCLCPRCGPHPTLFCRKSGRHPAACTPPAHQRLHGDLSLKAWHKRASLSNSRCLAAAWRLVITGFGAPPPPEPVPRAGRGRAPRAQPQPVPRCLWQRRPRLCPRRCRPHLCRNSRRDGATPGPRVVVPACRCRDAAGPWPLRPATAFA